VDERTFTIVGAGLAGAKAAETLRDEGFDGRIVLLGAEPERPYERPPLSKDYLQGKAPREQVFVHPPDWYAEHDVDLRLNTRATGLDPAGHTVTLDSGQTLRYDRLLLATGATPRRLDVPGADGAGARYLRTLEDADRLRDALAGGGRVVVVGAGWIGLEVAAAARGYGAAVTVVEADALPLRRVLGDDVATLFADLHRANGVDLRCGTGVREMREGVVVLSDGTGLVADHVLIGVGVQPDTALAASGGLAIDNGVLVDAGLRTSAPDVFACGDVANVDSPLVGARIRVEHWANAIDGGTWAARAMLDQPVRYDRVPYFFTDQFDLGMEYSGYVPPGGHDELVYRGGSSIAAGFVVFWLKAGRVLAGMNVNVWDIADDIQGLVRAGYAGRVVDRARLADPQVPLGDLMT
jgi:3-phenylpropionate/trans-cinnamate dioxygenase ferredoxin reductase component